MSLKKSALIIWLILVALPGLSQQKQGNIWMFGPATGLDFNNTPPDYILADHLYMHFSSASIADKDGQLLFYTNGLEVYDKNYLPMPGGIQLLGSHVHAGSAVIIPKPGDENIFYVFTADRWRELHYSVIDMRLNGGLGQVVQKNIPLPSTSSSGQIAAVAHANGKDIWVLTHAMDSNKYYALLVTDQGVRSDPVTSEAGIIHTFPNGELNAQLKFSADGKKVASAGWEMHNLVEVFDFDNTTGKLTLESEYSGFGGRGPWGLEFSPSGQYLYITEHDLDDWPTSLFQVEVGAPSGDINSVGTPLLTDANFGNLQLGPDGRIYMARGRRIFLGVINKPDRQDAEANVELDGHWLGGKYSSWGLPNFIQSYFKAPNFTETAVCFTDSTRFEMGPDLLAVADSVSWDFGDPTTGSANTSTDLSPVHVFSAPGDYTVTLTYYANGVAANEVGVVTIYPLPEPDLGSDKVLVQDEALDISLPDDLSYTWQDGETATTRQLTEAGWYSVVAINEGNCSGVDSLAVFTLTHTDACQSDIVGFNLDAGDIVTDSVTWNFDDPATGSANQATGFSPGHAFSAFGSYTVSATIYFNNRVLDRSFLVEIAAPTTPNLGPDETLLYGQTRELSAAGQGTSYLWQDNSTEETYLVQGPGTYWVEVTNAQGCTARDSVIINYDQLIEVSLPQDTVLCQGETLMLDASLPDGTYLWQDGSTNATFLAEGPGTYWVQITNAFQNRTKIDSILIDYYEFNPIDIVPEQVICSVQSVEMVATGAREGEVYRWYDENMRLIEETTGSMTTPVLDRTTDYFVTLSNGQCESPPVRWTVIYDEVFAEIVASDTLVKIGESIELNGFGGEEFRWSPDSWLSSSTEQFITASPERETKYTLTTRNAYGCEARASVRIYVDRDLTIPNVFTPNNDGYNDIWEITNIERFPNHLILIKDRQGNVIRNFTGYGNNWNGTKVDGTQLPTGTYFYIINLNDPDYELFKGSISIIR